MNLSYSVVASSAEVLVYRIPTEEAVFSWPTECQNEVKLKVLEKYHWFYERLLQIESQLSDKIYRGGHLQVLPNTMAIDNARTLEAARKVEKHTTNNYPQATQPIKNALKNKQMQISNKNDQIYLTTQNRRIHKYAQPLTGYVEESDFKRLEKIKNLVFPTFRAKEGALNTPRRRGNSNVNNVAAASPG